MTFEEEKGSSNATVKVSSENKQWTIGVFKDKMWKDKWKQKNVTRVAASKTDLTLDSLLDMSRSEEFKEKKYRQVMDLTASETNLVDAHEEDIVKNILWKSI